MFFSRLIPTPLQEIFEKGIVVFTRNTGQNCLSYLVAKRNGSENLRI